MGGDINPREMDDELQADIMRIIPENFSEMYCKKEYQINPEYNLDA